MDGAFFSLEKNILLSKHLKLWVSIERMDLNVNDYFTIDDFLFYNITNVWLIEYLNPNNKIYN